MKQIRNKKYLIVIVLLLIIVIICGCSIIEKEEQIQLKPKPVNVIAVSHSYMPIEYKYTGVIEPGELRKLGFKSPGAIEKICVKKGQEVEKGTVLAKLNTEDLEYAVEAAKAQYEGAKAQYERSTKVASDEQITDAKQRRDLAWGEYIEAKEEYEVFLTDEYEEDNPEDEMKRTRLELDMNMKKLSFDQADYVYMSVKELSLSAADQQYLESMMKQAQTDYEYKLSLLEAASLTSGIDGYVVEILQEEGEMVATGYPVVVIRNDTITANVGLSQKDISEIELGDSAFVEADGKSTEAEVTNISELPDSVTRKYNVELSLKEDIFKLGSIVKVTIPLYDDVGIWIPIQIVKSNVTDFVFVEEGGRAVKRDIKIQSMSGTHVKVAGLNKKDKVIVEGLSGLNIGDRVTVKEGDN